jgi:hypothetical protein
MCVREGKREIFTEKIVCIQRLSKGGLRKNYVEPSR